jgi:uncharacterized GH25 family protein
VNGNERSWHDANEKQSSAGPEGRARLFGNEPKITGLCFPSCLACLAKVVEMVLSRYLVISLLIHFGCCRVSSCAAHDIWIETNASIVDTNELIQVDYKLGNCADGRRNFRTSGLIDKDGTKVEAHLPSGRTVDLNDRLTSTSTEPSGGCWTTNFEVNEVGTTWLVQTLDQIILHDGLEMRGIVTGKAFVIGKNEEVKAGNFMANLPLDLPFELVLESSPFPSIEASSEIRVKLLVLGRELEGAMVNFLPKGINTDREDPSKFDCKTDSNGVAVFRPRKANLYLITARHVADNTLEVGPQQIYYSTSLTVRVRNKKLVE